MPFIDSKITVAVSEEKKNVLKAKLGKAVSILGKSERYLMVGFADQYDLFMAGEKLDKGAFVSVSLFGNSSPASYDKMTGAICEILEEELGIPGEHIYVTYRGVSDWGWNGSNF